MENEFDRNYANEIALECSKMEKAVTVGLEEYDDSSSLLGKGQWYAIGLENNDSDKTKDDVNKRNILLRIIDGVVNFIKMVGTKIVEWFKRCKEAILRFFGKEAIDPKDMGSRFEVLTNGMREADATSVVGKLSQESKAFLAEVLDTDYSKAFSSLYSEYRKVKDKCSTIDSFSNNSQFFKDFIEKSADLKTIAKNNKISEGADASLKKLLSGQDHSESIKATTAIFNDVKQVHDSNVDKIKQLLKKIPQHDFEGVEGTDVHSKRREAIKLLSDVLKIDGEIVLKVNNYMQAIAMLMTYIVRRRTSRLVYIGM